jgi:hypothetical protein
MSVLPPPVWNDLSDESCGTMIWVCTEIRGGVPAPAGVAAGSFQWHEQDPGDDVADEVLAWAAAEEAASPQPDCALAR